MSTPLGDAASYILRKAALGTVRGADAVIDGAVKAGKYTARETVIPLVKKGVKSAFSGEKNFTNAYTGLKETNLMKVGVLAAAGAYVGIKGFQTYHGIENPFGSTRIGETSYAGAAPELSYDGVANTTSAPTLGASGDLVFGLHNMRRG